MSGTPAVAQPLQVDAHLLKFSQGSIVVLTALAFIFSLPWLVVLAALALTLSALIPTAGPFRWLYRSVVLPLHLWKPYIVEDDPAPHRFAQTIGAIFLIVASLALLLMHLTLLGWILDLIVFMLAGINLTVGFCAGCFVYYHLGRLGLLPRVRYNGSFRWRGV